MTPFVLLGLHKYASVVDCTMATDTKSKKESADAAATAKRRTSGGTGLNDMFIVVFSVAFLVSCSLNLAFWKSDEWKDVTSSSSHSTLFSSSNQQKAHDAMHQAMPNFAMKKKSTILQVKPTKDGVPFSQNDIQKPVTASSSSSKTTTAEELHNDQLDPPELKLAAATDDDIHLSQLNCEPHGGPTSLEEQREVVYWQDIPSDAQWVSPFHPKRRPAAITKKKSTLHTQEYLTFEPDGGGWNNIRMAMETVIALGVAMGRTIVMPPAKKMYLLGANKDKQKQHFSFVDFFPIFDMAQEQQGLTVISMQEYLEQEGMKGHLINRITGQPDFPPNNRTDWEGIGQGEYDQLRYYLRNVSHTAMWNPNQCLPAFPSSGNHKDVAFLQDLVPKANMNVKLGNPHAVDSTDVLERLEETLSKRQRLCVYDEALQVEPVVHFQMNHKENLRLLVHFYAFLFFEDWKEDLWMKRFIRDHVRYIDPIQCAAARVVAAVRKHVRQRDPSNKDGIFDAFHIRRGDFQFKTTRIDASEIYENAKDELTPNSTIFIATDERDKAFFDPLRKHYDLLFLDDFQEELKGVNTNYYGMIDQLVSSRGRIFFGCWFSTFTGYITRIRGYHSQNNLDPGYEDGVLPTTFYYATKDKKFILHKYSPLTGGFFNREFPTSWRLLNTGIDVMDTNP